MSRLGLIRLLRLWGGGGGRGRGGRGGGFQGRMGRGGGVGRKKRRGRRWLGRSWWMGFGSRRKRRTRIILVGVCTCLGGRGHLLGCIGSAVSSKHTLSC